MKKCCFCVRELFENNGYATRFKSGKYIMSQSLFQQVYKGALGEVVGRYIIEKALGYGFRTVSFFNRTNYYVLSIN